MTYLESGHQSFGRTCCLHLQNRGETSLQTVMTHKITMQFFTAMKTSRLIITYPLSCYRFSQRNKLINQKVNYIAEGKGYSKDVWGKDV
jgi:hypothetical protein